MIQAPAPPHIVESGTQDEVELDRSLVAQWIGNVGFEVQPLAGNASG